MELGPSSLVALRYVRLPLRTVQYFYKTVWVLPFVLFGLVVLAVRKRFQELAILLAVPAYYLVVQSALHTERRYVYVLHFFFLILVAVALWWLVEKLVGMMSVPKRGSVGSP